MGRSVLAAALLCGTLLLVGALLQRVVAPDDARLRDPLFRVPSRLYSRPLVLRPGLDTAHAGLAEHLGAAGYRRRPAPPVGGTASSRRKTVSGSSACARFPRRSSPAHLPRAPRRFA
jgi:hypothetical protein